MAGADTAADAVESVAIPEGANVGRSRRRPLPQRLLALAATVILIAAAGVAAWWLGERLSPPTTSSAEAGFARDMQVHHQQAVELALLIRDRTDDPAIRTFAYDVATTQSQQAGQLYGWLSLWGLPQAPPGGKRMTWMQIPPIDGASAGMGHDAPSGASSTTPVPSAAAGEMPGSVSQADLDRLRRSSGVEAERTFLELLIAHHQGGVQMAEAVLARTRVPVVTTFARAIVTAQTSEMEYMRALLEERNGETG